MSLGLNFSDQISMENHIMQLKGFETSYLHLKYLKYMKQKHPVDTINIFHNVSDYLEREKTNYDYICHCGVFALLSINFKLFQTLYCDTVSFKDDWNVSNCFNSLGDNVFFTKPLSGHIFSFMECEEIFRCNGVSTHWCYFTTFAKPYECDTSYFSLCAYKGVVLPVAVYKYFSLCTRLVVRPVAPVWVDPTAFVQYYSQHMVISYAPSANSDFTNIKYFWKSDFPNIKEVDFSIRFDNGQMNADEAALKLLIEGAPK